MKEDAIQYLLDKEQLTLVEIDNRLYYFDRDSNTAYNDSGEIVDWKIYDD